MQLRLHRRASKNASTTVTEIALKQMRLENENKTSKNACTTEIALKRMHLENKKKQHVRFHSDLVELHSQNTGETL